MRKILFIGLVFILFAFKQVLPVNTDSLELIVNDLQGKEKVRMLSDLCYYLSYSDVEKSERYGNECLSLALKEGDSALIANAYNDLSILFTLKSDYAKGLEYNLKAYQIRKKLNQPEKLISSLSKIGVCYSELGEFKNATLYLLEAIEIVENNHLEEKYYLVYDNLGGVFKEMKNYRDALRYHEISYEYAVKANNERAIYTILVNMAGAHTNLGDGEKSIELHLEAEQFLIDSKDLRTKALVYSNLASLYSGNKSFDKALAYANLSIPIYQQLDNKDGLSLAYNNLAMFYLENNKLDKATIPEVEKYLMLAQKYADDCQSLARMAQNLESLSSFYMLLSDFEQALVYKLKYDSISNLVFTLENNKIVEELKTQYESEKKERELAENKLEIKQKNSQLIITLLVMLFIIIGAVENYRKSKFKREKLQEEARLKEEIAGIKLRSQIQDERIRISKDLHDNIGSQLTFIISSLEMANYSVQKNDMSLLSSKINEIRDFSAATIDEFRDTIWALNKESISLQDLELKISSFISKAKSMVPNMQFTTHFNAKKKLSLDAEKGIKVFRIIQESVNNAIKHSGAALIKVVIEDHQEFIRILVEDNGGGMEIDKIKRKSGLRNLEERAKQVGADFYIKSQIGQGTQICLKLISKKE